MFEVRNKLDDNTYAMKKIRLSVEKLKQNFNKILEKVLREVKFLARISHPNIIRYYNSWIELKSKDDNSHKFVLDSIVESPLKNLETKESSFEILWDYSDDVLINSSEISLQKQRKYAKSFDVFNEELNSISELTIFIQTEYCDETLEEYLDRRNAFLFDLKRKSGSLPQYLTSKANYMKEAHKILQQIISGLKYIHNNCFMVHRDLKPSNIFLNRNLHVKLGDFGLSKQLKAFSINNNRNFNDSLCISPHSMICPKLNSEMKFSENTRNCSSFIYVSPEQLKELSIFDQRADIYSLGVIALRLFHPMATMMEFFDVVKDLKGKKEISDEKKELSEILRRMLSEKQIERPNLQEIQRIFQGFCNENERINEEYKNLGMNMVKNEGNEVFVNKWLKIINKKLYVFRGCEEKKAEKVYNLEECNIFMGKDKEFIAIEHPFQMGCVIQAIGKQGILTEKLFQSFQELFDNRSDLKNFCFLSDKP